MFLYKQYTPIFNSLIKYSIMLCLYSINIPVYSQIDILLKLHNQYRAYKHVPALCLSSKLLETAHRFCKYMVDTQDFAHHSKNGDNQIIRANQSGYQWISLGENIGVSYNNELSVMMAWINSPSHEMNIKNSIFNQAGFAQCGNRPMYWVALFGRSNTEPCVELKQDK